MLMRSRTNPLRGTRNCVASPPGSPRGRRTLLEQVKQTAVASQDFDRRLVPIEAQCELLERVATQSRRSLPEKSET